MIMSGHPFIKALAAYWGGASVQGLRCHFISMPGKSPMKLEVTSRHDHSCLLGCKASKQTKKNKQEIYIIFSKLENISNTGYNVILIIQSTLVFFDMSMKSKLCLVPINSFKVLIDLYDTETGKKSIFLFRKIQLNHASDLTSDLFNDIKRMTLYCSCSNIYILIALP